MGYATHIFLYSPHPKRNRRILQTCRERARYPRTRLFPLVKRKNLKANRFFPPRRPLRTASYIMCTGTYRSIKWLSYSCGVSDQRNGKTNY